MSKNVLRFAKIFRAVETFREGTTVYASQYCAALTEAGELRLNACRRSDGSLGTVLLPAGSFELVEVDRDTGRRVSV
jgi:hypothetical protein